jgi:hypothetical protein
LIAYEMAWRTFRFLSWGSVRFGISVTLTVGGNQYLKSGLLAV